MAIVGNDREMDVAMGLGAVEDPVDITVILPAYNEEGMIEGVYKQVAGVLDKTDYSYEIFFVDDGSTDRTWTEIQEVAQKDNRVRALRHRRNFGKASALANGFTYGRGRIMVTSDADMQYDPYDIVRLIDKVNEGYDVVSAYKVIRRDPWTKRWPSKFFNWFVRTTTGVKLHDMNAGLKAYCYDAANDMVRYGYGELHRFFIVLAAQRGYRVAEVPVESCPRPGGRSKYGAERFMRGGLDYLTVVFLSGYTERPLHLLGGIGIFMFLISGAIFTYLLGVALFTGASMAGAPLLDVAVLFAVGAIQLIVAGLIAEMINNLDRGGANRSKISQVLRVDRRTALMLSPGVQVERRSEPRGSQAEAEKVLERLEPEGEGRHRRESDQVVRITEERPGS